MANIDIHSGTRSNNEGVTFSRRFVRDESGGYYVVNIDAGADTVSIFMSHYQFEMFVQSCEKMVEMEG